MKKIISLMLITVTLALLCSCQCEHTFGDWKITKEASCTASGTRTKTCTKCQETISETIPMVGHTWKSATCSKPKTCSVCGATDGKAKSHSWENATCTTAKKCKNCGKTDGAALGHHTQDYVCTRCKKSFVTKKDVPDILDISSINYEINSVGGIEWNMCFINKSSTKTIKYIYINLSHYNTVGDIVGNEIGGDKETVLYYTGPLAPGQNSYQIYWDAAFYCSSFGGKIHINWIRIEYTDGTELTLDENVAREAIVPWR